MWSHENPARVFDVTLERVRECQALAGGMAAITGERGPGGGPPRVGNRHVEFVAEFAMAAKIALGKNPRWGPRILLFHLYYLRGLDHRTAREELARAMNVKKVKRGTFDYWAAEIKRSVAPELERRGLFPPRLYFSDAGPIEAAHEARALMKPRQRRFS
jgi:hypothetical protein